MNDDGMVVPLPWDTEFLGLPVARLTPERVDARAMGSALESCRALGTRLLYFLCDGCDPDSVRLAETHGFRLTDIRVVYEQVINGGDPPRPGAPGASVRIREAGTDDLPALREMSRGAYTRSRFYFDQRIPTERADALYVTWMENLLRGRGSILLAEESGEPIGYIGLTGEPGSDARIELVAVAPRARGGGIGTELVRASLRWAAEVDCPRIEVVTHGRDVPAQRLYQKCGFLLAKSALWYHRWF